MVENHYLIMWGNKMRITPFFCLSFFAKPELEVFDLERDGFGSYSEYGTGLYVLSTSRERERGFDFHFDTNSYV